MDKIEKRRVLVNLTLVLFSIILALMMVIYTRGGLAWFSNASWSRVSWLDWLLIIAVTAIALPVQYFIFNLLRYSIVRYLVLWLLPVIWLFNNGMVAIQRLLEFAADDTFITGWIPITDLIGWLLGVVFFPMLIAGGVIVALVDSASVLFIDICRVAGVALDISGASFMGILGHVWEFLGTYLDLLYDSFKSEVITEDLQQRSFWDLGINGVFRLPRWLHSAGYHVACILG